MDKVYVLVNALNAFRNTEIDNPFESYMVVTNSQGDRVYIWSQANGDWTYGNVHEWLNSD